jgi:hypothetical protein
MEGDERKATYYTAEGSTCIIVDNYTWCFCEHKAVKGNLLENDGTDAGLMLMTELKFVKDIIRFSDETFDLPINTDLNGLVISGSNAVDELQFF